MALPDAPNRSQFPETPEGQEAFEEAMGFWQSRVGRIRGMVDRANKTAHSQVPASTHPVDAAKASEPSDDPMAGAGELMDRELQEIRRKWRGTSAALTPDPSSSETSTTPTSPDPMP